MVDDHDWSRRSRVLTRVVLGVATGVFLLALSLMLEEEDAA